MKWLPPREFRKFVDFAAQLVKTRLRMQEYEVTIYYHTKLPDKRYKDGVSADVEVDTRYLEVEINVSKRVYDDYYKQGDRRYIVGLLCHEMVHALTDPYYEFCWELLPQGEKAAAKKAREALRTINEQQTERISRIVMQSIRPNEYEDIKKNIARHTCQARHCSLARLAKTV